MTEWPTARLGDVTTKIGSGATPRGGKEVYVRDGVAFVRSQNVYDDGFERNGLVYITDVAASALCGVTVQEADVLICITGESVTRCCLAPSEVLPARVSQHVAIVRPDAGLDARFLLAALQSPPMKAHLNQLSSGGATRRALTKSHLASLTIPMPPIEEQRRIAGVLGALDDLIDTNLGLVAVLDAQLRLGHRALLGKGPVAEVGLLDAFEIDFGDPFRGTGFCEPGSGLPLLRIRDLKTYAPQVWTTERIPGDTLVQPGDLLVGMDAEFRPTFWLGEPALLNQRVCRVRPRTGSVAFAREAIRGPLAYIEGYKTGTTVIHLNKRDLADARVQMPDPEHLAQYDSAAVPIHFAIVALDRENEDLRRTRDELLPLLLSGRVSSREVAA